MKTINWKAFVISLAAQFIITVLLNLGLRSPQALNFLQFSQVRARSAGIVSPLPKNLDIWETVKPKLEQKLNDFHLKKEVSFAPSALAAADYDAANAYVVIDNSSGQILAEKGGADRLPIASLTKVMTAVVALDLASPEESFTVPAAASTVEPTSIGVVPGQQMTLKELLSAMLMTSANDAAEVVRSGIDQKYSQPIFVQAMNEKARILGLKNTHFANPQGFDAGDNYSCAEDLAVLSHYALTNYPLIAQTVKQDYQFLPANAAHKQFDLYNWNGLLGVYPGTSGVKIGNTDDAGYTTVVVAQRGNSQVLVVLLGAPGVLQRDLWASQLLDAGFAKLGISPVGITEGQLRLKYATWKYWG